MFSTFNIRYNVDQMNYKTAFISVNGVYDQQVVETDVEVENIWESMWRNVSNLTLCGSLS